MTYFSSFGRGLLALLLLGAAPVAHAQTTTPTGKVGIGTTSPTQQLDVNGNLRVRGLSGFDQRLPVVLPDGTLGVNAPVYGTVVPDVPAAVAGSIATGSQPFAVALSGTTAYVVNKGSDTFQTFNVSNPASPVLLGTMGTNFAPTSVAVSGTTAYVVNSQSNTLQVFDVSNPASPVLRGSVGTGNGPFDVAVSGSTAYVVNSQSNSLQTFDVSNPASPALLGTVGTDSFPLSVAVSGSTACVANNGSDTFQTFDVGNPASPVLRRTVRTGRWPNDLALSGTTLYVVNDASNTLETFDVSNPTSPVALGTVGAGNGPYGVAVSGTTAYVANYYGNTVQAFGVSNPASPVLLGQVSTGTASFQGPLSVAASGSTVCVVTGDNQLKVFRFVAPTRAVVVNADGSLGSVVLPAATDYIHNQTTQQSAASFNIDGSGQLGGNLGVSGSLGVGTTATPVEKLELKDGSLQLTATTGTALPASVGISNNSGSLNLGLAASATHYSALAQAGDAVLRSNGGKQLVLAARDGGNVLLSTGPSGGEAERLRVTPAGNVGIGTDTPGQRLEVAGGIKFTGAGQALTFPDGTTQTSAALTNVILNQTKLQSGASFNIGGSGYVGERLRVGTVGAAGALEVVGPGGTTTTLLDQQFQTTSSVSNESDIWQSFTAGLSGSLSQLDLLVRSPTGATTAQGTLYVYAGEGTGGTLLTSQPITLQTTAYTFKSYVLTTAVPVLQGEQYTYRVTTPTVQNSWFSYKTTNNGSTNYTGGRSSLAAVADLLFRTYVSGVQPLPMFTVLASGNVGIGTSSPGQKLEVAGNVKMTGSGNGLTFPDNTVQTTAAVTASGTSFIQNQTSADQTGGFRVSGNGSVGGNVGIGTTGPSQKLDVRGNLRLGTDGGSSATGLGQTVEFVGPGFNTDPVGLYRTNPASNASELRVVVGDGADPNDKFVVGRSAATAEGGLATATFTPSFTVRGDGNVGIGTSTPGQPLAVQAGTGVTSPLLGFYSQAGADKYNFSLQGGGLNLSESGVASGRLFVQDGTGNVGIGNTSPGHPLTVQAGAASNSPLLGFYSQTGTDKYNFSLSGGGLNLSESSVASARIFVQNGTGNVGIGTDNPFAKLVVNGVFCATGGTNCTSDARYKREVTTLSGALAKVLALRGVNYYWKQAEFPAMNFGSARQVGVIAQEVEKIYPELVSTGPDGFKSVNYAQLTPVLIEALKEQQQQIEALKAAAAAAKAEAAGAKAQAAQATATLETFEARLRRLEAAGERAGK